jgi:hypothetical protein
MMKLEDARRDMKKLGRGFSVSQRLRLMVEDVTWDVQVWPRILIAVRNESK